jgi:hypothetical protein
MSINIENNKIFYESMVQKKRKKKVEICVSKIHKTGGYFGKCNKNSGFSPLSDLFSA